MTVRTSNTHPLRIDQISCAPHALGVIGVTFCPGKCADSVHGAPWQRDLDIDLDALRGWGAAVAITLIEQHEFSMLGVDGLAQGFRTRGIEWHHLPIADLDAPGEAFHVGWTDSGRAALDALKSGKKVLVHCRGGLGRAGTVACLLLVELGFHGAEALRRVRDARPGSVETSRQEAYVSSYVAHLRVGRA